MKHALCRRAIGGQGQFPLGGHSEICECHANALQHGQEFTFHCLKISGTGRAERTVGKGGRWRALEGGAAIDTRAKRLFGIPIRMMVRPADDCTPDRVAAEGSEIDTPVKRGSLKKAMTQQEEDGFPIELPDEQEIDVSASPF
jgi:hypothetical protein